jgi:hypothetical protein
MKTYGLVDILGQSQRKREPTTKPVAVEGNAEQQRVPLLPAGRAAGGPRGARAFRRGADRRDPCPLIKSLRVACSPTSADVHALGKLAK